MSNMFSSVTGDMNYNMPVFGMMHNFTHDLRGPQFGLDPDQTMFGGPAGQPIFGGNMRGPQPIGEPASRPEFGNQLPGYIQPLNDPMQSQPVAGPVAPAQQPNQMINQYQPYFQQMRQNIAGLDRSLQQFEQNMSPGQQGYSMGNNRLGMF